MPLDCRHIWIATPPRTGSTWAFNVVRHALLWHGTPTHHSNLAKGSYDALEGYKENLQNSEDQETIYLYKVHAIIHETPPQSKFISIFRNPIEVIASFMRFSFYDFEQAFAGTCKMIDLIQSYQRPDRHNDSLVLQYADITETPEQVIHQILSFLKIAAPPDLVAFLLEKLEKRAVARSIKDRDFDLKHRLIMGEPVDEREVVQLSDKAFRVLDPESGFQSGHISTMSEDDYVRAFTPEQLDKIHQYYGDWVRKRL